MLGNILFQILMFIIIWDIYLRIGGQNTNLKNRILYLLFTPQKSYEILKHLLWMQF